MDSLYKKNAWITGHNGFIGTQLKKDLNNFNLYNVSRGNIVEKNLIIKRRTNLINLKKNKINKIKNNFLFHLATTYNPRAKTLSEIIKLIEDNMLFGFNFLDSFDNLFFKKILTTQSYMEYNMNLDKNLYALTKSIFAIEINKIFSHKLIKIYLYDTFGLNDNRNKLIKIWLKKLLKNKPLTIYSKKNTINLSNKNFVSNIISKIEKIKPGSYEIRSQVELTLEDLASLLKNLTNSRSKIILKNEKPISIHKRYDNLADNFQISYGLNDFIKDINEIIELNDYV